MVTTDESAHKNKGIPKPNGEPLGKFCEGERVGADHVRGHFSKSTTHSSPVLDHWWEVPIGLGTPYPSSIGHPVTLVFAL